MSKLTSSLCFDLGWGRCTALQSEYRRGERRGAVPMGWAGPLHFGRIALEAPPTLARAAVLVPFIWSQLGLPFFQKLHAAPPFLCAFARELFPK